MVTARRLWPAVLLGLACAPERVTIDAGARSIAPPVRAGEPVQTDALAYTATLRSGEGSYRRYGFRVVAQYTNRTGGPVYLATCYPNSGSPMYGVQLLGDTTGGGAWGSVFNPTWACVGHDAQIEVAPGATRADTLTLAGPNAWDGYTKVPFGTFDGRVRLLYDVQTCRGDGACRLTREAGVSNAFDVTVAR